MLPNFLCVGAQRTGTTWLFECLREHPEINIPDIKEINYFSDINSKNYYKGLEWYKTFFDVNKRCSAVGEITPEYLVDPLSPERIKSTLGDIKIIIILRNPVERAFSSYGKGMRENNWHCSFTEFVEKNMDYCIDRGRYYEQINRYYDFFSEKNILIMLYSDIKKAPEAFLRDVFCFLNVDNTYTPSQTKNRFNFGIAKRNLVTNFVVGTRNFIKNVPVMNKSIDVLQRNSLINKILVNTMLKRKHIDTEIVNSLRNIFLDDIKRLSVFLNKDFEKMWLDNVDYR